MPPLLHYGRIFVLFLKIMSLLSGIVVWNFSNYRTM